MHYEAVIIGLIPLGVAVGASIGFWHVTKTVPDEEARAPMSTGKHRDSGRMKILLPMDQALIDSTQELTCVKDERG